MSLHSLATVISGLLVQCQAPEDSSSLSMSVLGYGLSVRELDEGSLDYEYSNHHRPCVPLRTTCPSAAVADRT